MLWLLALCHVRGLQIRLLEASGQQCAYKHVYSMYTNIACLSGAREFARWLKVHTVSQRTWFLSPVSGSSQSPATSGLEDLTHSSGLHGHEHTHLNFRIIYNFKRFF